MSSINLTIRVLITQPETETPILLNRRRNIVQLQHGFLFPIKPHKYTVLLLSHLTSIKILCHTPAVTVRVVLVIIVIWLLDEHKDEYLPPARLELIAIATTHQHRSGFRWRNRCPSLPPAWHLLVTEPECGSPRHCDPSDPGPGVGDGDSFTCIRATLSLQAAISVPSCYHSIRNPAMRSGTSLVCLA